MGFFPHRSIMPMRSLKPGEHQSNALLEQAVRRINKPMWLSGKTRKAAMSDWKRDRNAITANLHTRPLTAVLHIVDLRHCMRIFDDLFFGSSIAQHCTIRLDPTLFARTNAWGETGRVRGGAVEIWLATSSKLVNGSCVAGLLSTLLHEMCHAYFRIYCCTGACMDPGCTPLAESSRGPSGHGRSWCILAEAVESRARGLLGLAGVDLNRARHEKVLKERYGHRR